MINDHETELLQWRGSATGLPRGVVHRGGGGMP